MIAVIVVPVLLKNNHIGDGVHAPWYIDGACNTICRLYLETMSPSRVLVVDESASDFFLVLFAHGRPPFMSAVIIYTQRASLLELRFPTLECR